jgi:hypothetical protein
MTSDIVKSAQGFGNLCRIMNRNIPRATVFESAKVVDKGKCPHCGMKMVKHIVKEGAKYHVHSYNKYTDRSRSSVRCSDPHCEDNHGIGKCVNSSGELYFK